MKLSASSIQLLNNDKQKWWWKYLLKIKEDIDDPKYFLIGRSVHKGIEHFNKTGEDWLKAALDFIKEEVSKIEDKSILQECSLQVQLAIDNYMSTDPEQHDNQEVYMETKYKDHYILWYIDAINNSQVIDYKAVSRFTEADTKLFGKKLTKIEEYTIQALIYVFLAESKWFEIDQVRFIEILKKDTTIKPTTTIKKDKLINMIKENYKLDDEPTGTKPQLLEKYPLRWEAVKEIVFDVTEEFRKDIVKLLDESIEQIETLLK